MRARPEPDGAFVRDMVPAARGFVKPGPRTLSGRG